MSNPSWIDCDYTSKISDTYYLVEVLDTSSGNTSWSLHKRPLRTNRSLQPRLSGWCGETNKLVNEVAS